MTTRKTGDYVCDIMVHFAMFILFPLGVVKLIEIVSYLINHLRLVP